MLIRLFLISLALFALTLSCAPRAYIPGRPEGFGPGDIVDTEKKEPVSFKQMVQKMGDAGVVFVGEVHSSPADHEMQLNVIRSLHEMGENIAVGLEMLPRELQPALNRFTGRETTEREFLKEVDWPETWGHPYVLYRPIFMFARENGIELVALNAPARVVKKVAREGLDSLTQEEKSLIAADIVLTDDAHREFVREAYEAHDELDGFEEFYQAQCVWDETMAETVADYLKNPEGASKKIVVLAGRGHLSFRFGIPERVHRRTGVKYSVALPFVVSGFSTELDPDIADYVWVREEEEERMRRARLGVRLKRPEEGEEGIEILEVLPDSRAEEAGMEPGDRIIEINGYEIKTLMDLHRVAAEAREKMMEIELMRKGERVRAIVKP